MSPSPDLKEALIDLRKAYRFIWLYQRRILDLVKETASMFDLDFYGWSPIHFERIGKLGTDPTGKWAWDLIPLYCASFLYVQPSYNHRHRMQGEWMLEIGVNSDDGYDPSSRKNVEPNVSDFPPPEECNSLFGLYCWFSTKTVEGNDWFQLWDWNSDIEPPRDGKIIEYKNLQLKITGMEYDLHALKDKESLIQVVSDFKKHIKKAFDIDS